MSDISQFDFSKRFTKARKLEFAAILMKLSKAIGFRVSSRGWGYIMEQRRYINKDQFDRVEAAINDLRRDGSLPVDFVSDEASRAFKNVQKPSEGTPFDTLAWMLRDVLNGSHYFTPDWWKGEKYYIQMVVEKVDLVTLFLPVCEKYKIPIANAKGWSSILMRAEYCRRFKEAEAQGLKCVLLYCGDHDPDGLRISDQLRQNLEQVSEVVWSDGTEGYDPSGLIIDRFGLNYDFIMQNGLTWIDNLTTGSGSNLADPKHPNHYLPYLQDYLRDVGERKCESNAIVVTPKSARQLCEDAIVKYLGHDAPTRFKKKTDEVERIYQAHLEATGLRELIEKVQAESSASDADLDEESDDVENEDDDDDDNYIDPFADDEDEEE